MIIEELTEDNYIEKLKEGNDRVNAKIERFEYVSSPIDKIREEYKNTKADPYLLLDPTIWAYRFLRDKQGKPYQMRGFQDKIINDKHRFIMVAAANQIGKTQSTACIKGLHHALHVNNASVLMISKSETQAISILDEIKNMMRSANIKFDSIIGEVENRTELHIKNTNDSGVSVIRCFPPTTSVLGFYATLIIMDEVAFWEIERMSESQYFYQIIETRTNATKNWKNRFFTMGQIIIITNPNGQRGLAWDIWNNDERFHKYRYCWLANQENSIEEYNEAKTRLSHDVFDSSYAAVFTSESGGFITGEEFRDAVKIHYEMALPFEDNLYLGGDFAGEDTVSRNVDDSILFGAVKVKIENKEIIKIVYLKEFQKRTPKAEIIDETERLSKTYSVPGFAYDKQGVGDSIKSMLIERGIFSEHQIEALTYSLPNKSEVYYNIKHLFEQRRIMLPNNPKLKEQLLGLRFKKTTGGHMQTPNIIIHHEREGLHDDYADALANCVWLATKLSTGIGLTIIEIEKPNTTHKKNPKLRKAIICKECDENKYSSYHESGICDECNVDAVL